MARRDGTAAGVSVATGSGRTADGIVRDGTAVAGTDVGGTASVSVAAGEMVAGAIVGGSGWKKQASPRIIMHSISNKGFNFIHASRGNLQMINSIGQIRTGRNPPQVRRGREANECHVKDGKINKGGAGPP